MTSDDELRRHGRSINPGDEESPGTPQTGETLCWDCNGNGKLGDKPCPTCQGTGRVIVDVGDA